MTRQEKSLRKFLMLVISGNYEQAFDLCQKTWQDGRKVDDLRNIFKDHELTGFKIIGWTRVSNVKSEFKTEIESGGNKHEAVINMICESWPHKTEPFGDWGANPVSVMKGVKIEKKEPAKPQEKKAQPKAQVKKGSRPATKKRATSASATKAKSSDDSKK